MPSAEANVLALVNMLDDEPLDDHVAMLEDEEADLMAAYHALGGQIVMISLIDLAREMRGLQRSKNAKPSPYGLKASAPLTDPADRMRATLIAEGAKGCAVLRFWAEQVLHLNLGVLIDGLLARVVRGEAVTFTGYMPMQEE
jgi:hypothetical protein